MRHHCRAAPGKVAPTAAIRPGWASEVTSCTPDRPRAARPRPNASQPARSQRWPPPCRGPPGARRGRSRRGAGRVRARPDRPREPSPPAHRPSRTWRARPPTAGPERLCPLVPHRGHAQDLGGGQAHHAPGLGRFLHPPSRHTQQVAGGHHRGGLLGPPAGLGQPLGTVRTCAQRGDRQLDRARPDSRRPGAVAVPHPDATLTPRRTPPQETQPRTPTPPWLIAQSSGARGELHTAAGTRGPAGVIRGMLPHGPGGFGRRGLRARAGWDNVSRG